MPAKGTRKSKDKERKKEVSPTSTVNTRSRDKKDSADVAHALALSQKDHLQQQEMQEEEDRTLRLTLRRSLRDVSTAKTPPGYVRDVDGKLFVSSARHIPPPSFLCVFLNPPICMGDSDSWSSVKPLELTTLGNLSPNIKTTFSGRGSVSRAPLNWGQGLLTKLKSRSLLSSPSASCSEENVESEDLLVKSTSDSMENKDEIPVLSREVLIESSVVHIEQQNN
jgi:hypothetical protein